MFKPYEKSYLKDQIKTTKRIIKDLIKQIKKETYEPHKNYLIQQIEAGKGELAFYQSQL